MNNQKVLFADIGVSHCNKHGQKICGDVFNYRQLAEDNRIAAVLSDGLGSGVKANILANMTVTMALKFMQAKMEIISSVQTIIGALPCCRKREISYATFTMIDILLSGKVKIIELDNPDYLTFRTDNLKNSIAAEKSEIMCAGRAIHISEFAVKHGDRLVFLSDGISQAGIGSDDYPAGWGIIGCRQFISDTIKANLDKPAMWLADMTIREALRHEPQYRAGDDMTCAVIHFREPRQLIVVTGPPFDHNNDHLLADKLANFHGTKIICGGTTANIIARESGKTLNIEPLHSGDTLPPCSTLEDIDLVTEGIFTLTQVEQYLENGRADIRNNAAGKLVKMLLVHDIIEFHVGTRVNQAHQDPNLPFELEIRRNIVKRIAAALQNKYYKTTTIEYH
jgi:hypothetical protein